MNLYKSPTNDLIFTNNIYADFDLLSKGEFTEDEIKYGKDYKNGKIIIDTVRKDADKALQTQKAKDEANRPIIFVLSDLDRQSIRPLRAILATFYQKGGLPDSADIEKLKELEQSAQESRNNYII